MYGRWAMTSFECEKKRRSRASTPATSRTASRIERAVTGGGGAHAPTHVPQPARQPPRAALHEQVGGAVSSVREVTA
jgi:hypothetical protein